MRTRQLRLNDLNQIQRKLPEFLGKRINIVLSDRTVMFGELKKVNESEIILRNMRMENVRYAFKNIVEIYLDAIV